MKDVILTDIDGCLIQWQSGLPYFLAKHSLNTEKAIESMRTEAFISPAELFGLNPEIATKLLKEYNNSKFIRYLGAYRDALSWVNEAKKTYDFVAVTALSDKPEAILNRLSNLNALFPGAFIDIMSCGFGESKTEMFKNAVKKYDGRIISFIDDLAINIDDAAEVLPKGIHYYHIIRGPREPVKTEGINCTQISNLNAIHPGLVGAVAASEIIPKTYPRPPKHP